MNNPLLQDWDTPFETPPFNYIETAHFKPAVEKAIHQAAEEIKVIAENTNPPGFENTIAALDRSGTRLGIITSVLFNLNNAETNKELQAVVQEVSPLLTRFSNDITLNEKLFSRVRHLYESRENLNLDREQMMLLEKSYRNFMLGGAGLNNEKKSHFRKISEELSLLSVKFEENILEDTNSFELHLTDINELAGLPEGTVEMSSMEARNRGKEGWIFTLHAPSYVPFMKYSQRRDLREKLYKAYTSRAFHSDRYDNRKLAVKFANLRLELAKILGFRRYSDLILDDRMLDTTTKVESFLAELHEASIRAARRDVETVNKFASENGHADELERWDWPYFAEKLRKVKFDIDDEVLRPYFVLENLENAILDLASVLYGIKFIPDKSIQVYNPEIKTWQVRDHDDSFLAVLYADYFPRPGKNGGAWMTSYREQRSETGKEIRPLISIVSNFTRPTETRPSLLSFDEVTTFLHEFGHALHGMLSKCRYESLSGTNVARDFVELPSQFMENYAFEKEWLSKWARHYKTGRIIPDTLIDKIKASATFNEGYACNRQLSFGFLDMAWHTISTPVTSDICDFEKNAITATEIFPAVAGSNISVSFSHIFSGGYAAGYYGYKWSEVLDADAFSYLCESGIFDKEITASFRKNILEKGASDKPMDLYKNFRGKEPSLDAFLNRSGLR